MLKRPKTEVKEEDTEHAEEDEEEDTISERTGGDFAPGRFSYLKGLSHEKSKTKA